jgi:hypothetical protein
LSAERCLCKDAEYAAARRARGGMSPLNKHTGPDTLNDIATVRIELRDTDPATGADTSRSRFSHDIVRTTSSSGATATSGNLRLASRDAGSTGDEWGVERRLDAGNVLKLSAALQTAATPPRHAPPRIRKLHQLPELDQSLTAAFTCWKQLPLQWRTREASLLPCHSAAAASASEAGS